MKKIMVLFMFLIIGITHAGEMNTVFKKGDIQAGARFALGSVLGSNSGIMLNAEYGFMDGPVNWKDVPNSFGIGLSLGYSSYHHASKYGDYIYSNFIFSGAWIWHVDLLKNPQMDTYASFNMGINLDSYTRPDEAPPRSSSYSDLIWGFAIGARYQFTPRFSAVGELGYGLGFLRLGVDYRF